MINRHYRLSIGALALLGALAGPAWAQSDNAQDKQKATDQTSQADQKPDAKADAPDAKDLPNEATFGFLNWSGTPIGNRLYHNGFISRGLMLTGLHLGEEWGEDSPYYDFLLHDLPNNDFWGGGRMIINEGLTELNAYATKRTYSYLGFIPVADSEDRSAGLMLSQTLSPNTGLYVSLDKGQRSQYPQPPYAAQQSRTQNISMGIDSSSGPVQGGLNYTEHRYTDQMGLQPTTFQQRWLAGGSFELGDSFALTGAASYTKIQQDSLPDSGVRQYAATADMAVNDMTRLRVNFSREDLSLPNVQSDHDTARMQGGARLLTKAGHWNLQAGYQHMENRHLDSDLLTTETPKWNLFDASLNGRLDSHTRLTIKANLKEMTQGYQPGTLDPALLIWRDESNGQLKVERGTDTFSGYFTASYSYKRNADRDVRLNWFNFSLGASAQFGPKLTGYGELSYDTYRGGNTIVVDSATTLRSYLPSSATTTFGLDYAKSDNESYSAAAVFFGNTDGAGADIALRYHRKFADASMLDVSVSPWSFSDRLYGVTSANDTFLSIRYTVKF